MMEGKRIPLAAATLSVGGKRGRAREVTAPGRDRTLHGQRDRQLQERAGVAGELHDPRGDRARRDVVVPYVGAGSGGHIGPARDLLR